MAQISGEKGTLQVRLEDPQENKATVTIEPGQTARIKGTTWVIGLNDDRSFRVYFEPLSEGEAKRAENVRAEIRHNMP